MRLYEGEPVSLLGAVNRTTDGVSDNEGLPLGGDIVEVTLALAQSLVDALDAKIGGLEKTKPQITTTQAKWDVRRKARLSDRFIEGQFFEKQGRFNDLWEMFRFGFRLSQASVGTTAVKFRSSFNEGKIRAEIHDTLSMCLESAGNAYDYPTGLSHVSWWDVERAIDLYGDAYPGAKDDLWAAKKKPQRALGLDLLNDDADYQRDNIERVPIVDGWRFKFGARDGVFCKTFAGAKAPLEWAPYKYEDPPFVFLGGQKSLTSFWHRPLLKSVVAPIIRVNEILAGVDRAERLTPKGVMFFDPEEITKELLEVGDDFELIPVPGLSSMKGKPIYEAPPPFHPLVLELIRFYIEQIYAITGVSEMNSAADVKGDWSGAALRIRKQLINERFSVVQSEYVHATTVEASKQIIRCAKEICDRNGKFGSTWKGDGFINEIDSSVLAVLDDNKYDVGVYSVSESKNTPESRVQLAEELMATQVITGEAYVSILQHFDPESETQGETQEQQRLIGIQIDKWLMAEPKEMRSPKFYRGPIRTLQLESAIVQVNRAYIKAMADEVDDRRLGYFKRYLSQLQKFLQDKQALMAPPTAVTPAAAPVIQPAATAA